MPKYLADIKIKMSMDVREKFNYNPSFYMLYKRTSQGSVEPVPDIAADTVKTCMKKAIFHLVDGFDEKRLDDHDYIKAEFAKLKTDGYLIAKFMATGANGAF